MPLCLLRVLVPGMPVAMFSDAAEQSGDRGPLRGFRRCEYSPPHMHK